MGILDICIISEELAAGCMGMYVSIFVSTLALYPIIRFGTEDQKERFLRPFCEKFSMASYCLSEPDGWIGSGIAERQRPFWKGITIS